MAARRLPHIILPNPPESSPYTSTSRGGGSLEIPPQNRQEHSTFLQNKLRQAWNEAEEEEAVYHVTRRGIYLEFKGEQGYTLVAKSLEEKRAKSSEKWIRLLNTRSENDTIYATVFVPHNKKDHFFDQIEKYANEIDARSGKPKNFRLINSIADLRKALEVESFWQDAKGLIPVDEPEWCEVWLSSDAQEVITRFESLLSHEEIPAKRGFVRFPERAVTIILANRHQLEQLTRLSDDIAEYRRAKETAAYWMGLPNREQAEWVANLLDRIQIDDRIKVSVCILDMGVNNGHPLLSLILMDEDCQSVFSEWGVHDSNGHGTGMAGIAAYGDLMKNLIADDPIVISHCLESVKILPPPPNQTEPELWGYIMAQGISLAEIQAPTRKRIVCMAITCIETGDRGRPSSWSAEVDQLAAGIDNEDGASRLIIISAGNISDMDIAGNYPDSQLTDSVQDPAQSWNALTVGAYTALDHISDLTLAGYEPVAPAQGLSPFSTTSCTWENKWPNKPDIVMEGGNLARDSSGYTTECDDLSLLTTYYDPQQYHFIPFSMTSAATAQAAWFAAQIQVSYPEFWPETIRALMVHSAQWPETMKQQFHQRDSKTTLKRLLRIVGYGVPNLERALYSASNSLTLIAQSVIQPFDKKENGGYKTKDMHLYELPWPKEVLQSLPYGTEVEMRITLSYFIEPGPGEIGWEYRYRYASHALRFDLNAPGESKSEFLKRINKAARDEEEGAPGTESVSDHWQIGSQARDKGSIHSDIWQGTAAELADSNIIAVVPRIGWWRERAHLGRWDRKTRYALVVSIYTPEESVDIYTQVATQIGIAVPVTITV
jgi:hypothetical protein